jgi:general secretion pathway protein G
MRTRGFTLTELLLVLLFIAILASLVIPVVVNSVHYARESALKEDLYTMRKAIDDYYADKGKYPESLKELADNRYLRKVPVDPMTDRVDSWVEIRNDGEGDNPDTGVIDVRTGSDEKDSDGIPYKDW